MPFASRITKLYPLPINPPIVNPPSNNGAAFFNTFTTLGELGCKDSSSTKK